MITQIDFNHYTTGSGKQKAWAHAITQNIIQGDDTLRKDDYAMLKGLMEEALVKCVMKEYMERLKRCEIDEVDGETFKRGVNQAIASVNRALQNKTTQAKREALIHQVRDAEVIINFRHSYSTLDWAQIVFIYQLNRYLNLNLKADDYRIKVCRA